MLILTPVVIIFTSLKADSRFILTAMKNTLGILSTITDLGPKVVGKG